MLINLIGREVQEVSVIEQFEKAHVCLSSQSAICPSRDRLTHRHLPAQPQEMNRRNPLPPDFECW